MAHFPFRLKMSDMARHVDATSSQGGIWSFRSSFVSQVGPNLFFRAFPSLSHHVNENPHSQSQV